MTFSDELKVSQIEFDPEMVMILEAMLEADEKITARAVARRHSRIKHASSITRSEFRSKLLSQYQAKQKEFRAWEARAPKRSREQLATQLAEKDVRIAELERLVEILQVSHVAMIRALGELGGYSKLLQLYQTYRVNRVELQKLGVLPEPEVTSIS